ncbi:hypothetical protein NL676_030956 [Syzygium grande]|nr:hypothetical protein NL676_030956 [Syzygium grande]
MVGAVVGDEAATGGTLRARTARDDWIAGYFWFAGVALVLRGSTVDMEQSKLEFAATWTLQKRGSKFFFLEADEFIIGLPVSSDREESIRFDKVCSSVAWKTRGGEAK